jgi:hypothetical protein
MARRIPFHRKAASTVLPIPERHSAASMSAKTNCGYGQRGSAPTFEQPRENRLLECSEEDRGPEKTRLPYEEFRRQLPPLRRRTRGPPPGCRSRRRGPGRTERRPRRGAAPSSDEPPFETDLPLRRERRRRPPSRLRRRKPPPSPRREQSRVEDGTTMRRRGRRNARTRTTRPSRPEAARRSVG